MWCGIIFLAYILSDGILYGRKLNLTRVIWRLSSLKFFSSPSTPSSPTAASNSGEVRVRVRVLGCWGALPVVSRPGGGGGHVGGEAGSGEADKLKLEVEDEGEPLDFNPVVQKIE